MRELGNCSLTMVSLYCDDVCVVLRIMLGGGWTMGPDPADDRGDVRTGKPAKDQWPQDVRSWSYNSGGKWESDSSLTVTGNMFNIINC